MPGEHLAQQVVDRVVVSMRQRRISASELARRTNTTQQYMSRRLTGAVEFNLSDLESIAGALDVPVRQLVDAGTREAS
jgi:transcriptional regulator with XRE-family HTH domain